MKKETKKRDNKITSVILLKQGGQWMANIGLGGVESPENNKIVQKHIAQMIEDIIKLEEKIR